MGAYLLIVWKIDDVGKCVEWHLRGEQLFFAISSTYCSFRNEPAILEKFIHHSERIARIVHKLKEKDYLSDEKRR